MKLFNKTNADSIGFLNELFDFYDHALILTYNKFIYTVFYNCLQIYILCIKKKKILLLKSLPANKYNCIYTINFLVGNIKFMYEM